MNLIEKEGDLLDLAEDGEIDVIVHQANLEHTFGAGIALAIRRRFPYAYRADLRSRFNDPAKLGSFTIGQPSLGAGERGPAIANLYSQTSLYPSHTSYDAMVEGLTQLRFDLQIYNSTSMPKVKTIGFPFGMGCGLADGDWNVVRAIIESVFKNSRFDIVIVTLPEIAKRAELAEQARVNHKHADFWDRKMNTIS